MITPKIAPPPQTNLSNSISCSDINLPNRIIALDGVSRVHL